MSEAKRKRTSKYHAADKAFVYHNSTQYNLEDFKNLSIEKLQSIASTMNLRNVKTYKKYDLCQLILDKHVERQSLLVMGHEEEKESAVAVVTSDALEFTEQCKKKFQDIVHCKYNNDVYFQASSIAEFLEYENTRKAIIDHVTAEDKTSWTSICTGSVTDGYSQGKLHPDTVFINKFGIFDLLNRSRMPLARQFRKWLVEEVLPSIINVGYYVSPEIIELQAKIQQIENEKQQLQLRLETESQIRLSAITRNQIFNSVPVDELYILTTRQYSRNYIYKIGTSGNTPKRLKTLNSARVRDEDLYICHMARCYDASSAEKRMHAFLDRYRLHNNREFFVLRFEHIRNLMDQVCASSRTDYDTLMEILKSMQNDPCPEINPDITPQFVMSSVSSEHENTCNVITNYYNKV